MNDNEIVIVCSAAWFVCTWLILRPQQTENKTLHGSVEKLSVAVDKLSDELQASREDRVAINEKLKSIFKKQAAMQTEIEELRSCIMGRSGNNG